MLSAKQGGGGNGHGYHFIGLWYDLVTEDRTQDFPYSKRTLYQLSYLDGDEVNVPQEQKERKNS